MQQDTDETTTRRRILVTGGTGYIGSHTIVELVQRDYDVVCLDDLSNSSKESLKRVETITGRSIKFVKLNLATDVDQLTELCRTNQFDACIHFAGFKSVKESQAKPMMYYRNNVVSTMNLVDALEAGECRSLVFSSSCTIYGQPESSPVTEKSPVGDCIECTYGRTKYFIEKMLEDVTRANPKWRVACLRYFNPVGAHSSGLIGEDPKGVPNCLMPYICQVAIGRRKELSVYGDDYATVDGTGVRDYIHVTDVALGHIAAIERDLWNPQKAGFRAYNLGTGKGTSVLQMIAMFERVTGSTIPYTIASRRAGDIGEVFADCSLAEDELGWKAKRSVESAIADMWRFQQGNPYGYLVEEKKEVPKAQSVPREERAEIS